MKDAIKSVTAAIAALEESKGDLKGRVSGTYLLQVTDLVAKKPLLANDARFSALLSKLRTQSKQEPAQYEYHSSDIIATLEALNKNFIEDKNKLDADEAETKNAYELEANALEN